MVDCILLIKECLNQKMSIFEPARHLPAKVAQKQDIFWSDCNSTTDMTPVT